MCIVPAALDLESWRIVARVMSRAGAHSRVAVAKAPGGWSLMVALLVCHEV